LERLSAFEAAALRARIEAELKPGAGRTEIAFARYRTGSAFLTDRA
jgi:hypothetical protein